MTNELTRKAMLVKVSVHRYHFRERDKQRVQELSEKYNVDPAMIEIKKTTMYKELTRQLDQAMNKVVPIVHFYTSPWRDGGWRILSVALYEKFQKAIRDCNTDIETTLEEFLADYETHKSISQSKLGGMAGFNDYPTSTTLREKFCIDVSYDPLPTAGDFRVEMSQETVSEIKKNIEDNSAKAMKVAMQTVWERVVNSLERLHERLSMEQAVDAEGNVITNKKGEVKKPRLYDSLLENIKDLVDILPGLNIDSDPQLEQIRQELESRFAHLTIDAIKQDGTLKQNTANEAKKLLDNIKQIF